MQDKAARLSEHLYEDHEECVGGRDLGGVDGVLDLAWATSWAFLCSPEGFMTMYQNIIDTSKKPAVARGLSEFDTFVNGVLNRVSEGVCVPLTRTRCAPQCLLAPAPAGRNSSFQAPDRLS